jgi:hypothetical protein
MDWDDGESPRGGSGKLGDDVAESATVAGETPVGSATRPVGRPWRKGQSGNPAGRPPRPRVSGAPGDRLIGAGEPTRDMILAEAYRLVTVEEDGKRREMPLNQAVLRAMGRAALSGKRLAQHRWTRIVREAEREQRLAQKLIYNAMERRDPRRDEKAKYTDDLVFDPTNGDVLVREVGESDAAD